MAKQNSYSQIAYQRAGFYTKGSPVQFVAVELLREDQTGKTLVTLSYKNIYNHVLTGLSVLFTCKNAQGQVVAQEDFVYENIEVQYGEMFGENEAVFVSDEELSGIDVSLLSVAFDGGKDHDLSSFEKVRLPSQRPLREEARAVLSEILKVDDVQYKPADLEEGWQCTCGAFNYKVGQGFNSCGECGIDKAALFNAMREVEAPAQSFAPKSPQRAPVGETKVFNAVDDTPSQNAQNRGNGTRMFTPQAAGDNARTRGKSIMSDAAADFVIKFVPFIAAGASIVYVLAALVIKTLLF